MELQEGKVIKRNNIVTNVLIGIAITALIGGFLLGLFKKDDASQDDMSNKESQMFNYEGNSQSEIDTENVEEKTIIDSNDDDKKSINIEQKQKEKQAVNEAKEKAKELEEDSHSDHYEKSINFLEDYKKKYSEEVVNKTVKLTHEVIFKLSKNETDSSTWESFSSEKMIKRVEEMKRDVVFLDFQIADLELVPIEKKFDGILIGVLIETAQGVSLLEFDFLIKNNQPILDDIITVW